MISAWGISLQFFESVERDVTVARTRVTLACCRRNETSGRNHYHDVQLARCFQKGRRVIACNRNGNLQKLATALCSKGASAGHPWIKPQKQDLPASQGRGRLALLTQLHRRDVAPGPLPIKALHKTNIPRPPQTRPILNLLTYRLSHSAPKISCNTECVLPQLSSCHPCLGTIDEMPPLFSVFVCARGGAEALFHLGSFNETPKLLHSAGLVHDRSAWRSSDVERKCTGSHHLACTPDMCFYSRAR